MKLHVVAALASAAVIASAAAAPAQTTVAPTPMPVVGPTATANPMPMHPLPIPRSTLALDARSLRGTRTATGYRLTGQALVRDACTDAKFQRLLGNIFPPFYNVVQYRRPGTMNLLCIQRLTWVAIVPFNATATARPHFVSVHSAKGTTRVPLR